jgi:hypothetical protein
MNVPEGQKADLSEVFFIMKSMKGRLPQDLTSLKAFRTATYDYLKEAFPEISNQKLSGIVSALTNKVRKGITTPAKLENPFISADGHTEIKEGDWVVTKNILNVESVGRVIGRRLGSDISSPVQSPDGATFQHFDNLDIEYVDGTIGRQITADHARILDPSDSRYGTPTKYTAQPTKKERIATREELLAQRLGSDGSEGGDDDDSGPEDDDISPPGGGDAGDGDETPPSGPTPVDDLAEGDTFYAKNGNPLGTVVGVEPIVGKGGKRGFNIAVENADGDIEIIQVAAGELRGPKG